MNYFSVKCIQPQQGPWFSQAFVNGKTTVTTWYLRPNSSCSKRYFPELTHASNMLGRANGQLGARSFLITRHFFFVQKTSIHPTIEKLYLSNPRFFDSFPPTSDQNRSSWHLRSVLASQQNFRKFALSTDISVFRFTCERRWAGAVEISRRGLLTHPGVATRLIYTGIRGYGLTTVA